MQLIPHRVRDAVVYRAICQDRPSRRRFVAAFSGPADRALLPVRLRALDGAEVWIRPGTDDPWVVRELVTYGDLWPPEFVDPRLIVDLGANIGISMALLANAFPEAHVIGVEPDPANAELCRRNIAPWAHRCELHQAAAWTEDGTIGLAGRDHSSFTVQQTEEGRVVPALSLNSLLRGAVADRHVDYMKVDVEGAERELLTRNVEWSRRVRCISVEVHSPYTLDLCSDDLRSLGFSVHVKPAPRAPRAVGVRT